MSELTVSPKGFDESLHFLCFSLNADMSLELSQGFIQLHTREVHLIHNAAIKRQAGREPGREDKKAEKEREKGEWFRCGVSMRR